MVVVIVGLALSVSGVGRVDDVGEFDDVGEERLREVDQAYALSSGIGNRIQVTENVGRVGHRAHEGRSLVSHISEGDDHAVGTVLQFV